jgi:hypothetical protein
MPCIERSFINPVLLFDLEIIMLKRMKKGFWEGKIRNARHGAFIPASSFAIQVVQNRRWQDSFEKQNGTLG